MSTAVFIAPMLIGIVIFALNVGEIREDVDDAVGWASVIGSALIILINLAGLYYYLTFIAPVINGH